LPGAAGACVVRRCAFEAITTPSSSAVIAIRFIGITDSIVRRSGAASPACRSRRAGEASLLHPRCRYHHSVQPQTLLIDADDTLWENNVYFERAIARFISFLNHHEFSPEQVREVLNDVERDCVVKHGYGQHSFSHALVDTFERLSVNPVTPDLHAQVVGFA